MPLQSTLDEIVAALQPELGLAGFPASYIPALAHVPAAQLGIAVCTRDGQEAHAGDGLTPFSIQSISKLFTLTLAMRERGESLWDRIGRSASGTAFNSLVQLEAEQGVPRNPFINAGALVVTDRLHGMAGDASVALLDFLRQESDNPTLAVDEEVARSEWEHSHRNHALAHFMASYGNLEHPVPAVLADYVRQCAVAAGCADLARAGLVFARHGLRADGSRLLTRSEAKRINAVMLTCGTYDAAGDFAYRVGLPCKSGVGGGLLAILPGRGALCVWSPPLDEVGNSVAGAEFLDRFTTRTGWSIF